jgi:4-diphosphocytidyl-2-C-methyl-D-erythritol kinase
VSEPLRLRAHAKINLALRVGPLDEDGYHPLATVFQTVSLCDLLYARRLEGGDGERPDAATPLRLRVAGAELPADNTVTRAVRLLAAEARAAGVAPVALDMRLVKRVPAGAGLGGGSGDAVAALAAAARLWGLPCNPLEAGGVLQRVAAEIGSDVPFFLYGGTALGTGRGTRIAPLEPLPRTWLVIAAPDVHIATPAAYAAFDRRAAVAAAEAGDLSPAAEPPQAPPYVPSLDPSWMGNDLAPAVYGLVPEVGEVCDRLRRLGAAVAQMTGSGAASFGAFATRRQAARAAARLRAQGIWAGVFVSVTGDRHRHGLFGPDDRSRG